MWCPTIETVALPDPIGTTPLDDALHGRRGQFDAVLFTSRKGIEEWLRRRPNEASRHQEGPTLYALGEPALHPLRMSELSHENILPYLGRQGPTPSSLRLTAIAVSRPPCPPQRDLSAACRRPLL